MEWTHVLLETHRYGHGPDPTAVKHAAKPVRNGAHGSARSLGGGGSGNVAFDEYREETLRKLRRGAARVRDFLDRLRAARIARVRSVHERAAQSPAAPSRRPPDPPA